MNKLNITFLKYLVVTLVIVASASVSTFAQEEISQDKKALILEFRTLTGANIVRFQVNFSVSDVEKAFLAIVEEDTELMPAQKVGLSELAKEAALRIDNQVKEFFADQSKQTLLSEKVINELYDKTFTESELRELVTFYKSSAGKKSVAFLPTVSDQLQQAFSRAVGPVLQSYIGPKMEAEAVQLKQKVDAVKEKGGKK